jgi:uncharacterized membrane protein YdbT with pleckstrin-like domain
MEEIITLRNSRKTYIPIYLMIITMISVIAYIRFSGKPINNLVFGAATFFTICSIAGTELHRIKNYYQITPTFLTHSSGYIAKETKKILIESIIDIDSKQSVWQRLAKFGNIDIFSYSGTNTINMKNISNPHLIIEILQEKLSNIK